MTEANFELLLQNALKTNNPEIFEANPAVLYKEFELAEAKLRNQFDRSQPNENINFKFEKIRLGIAVALMQVFSEISDDEDAHQVLSTLKKACKAASIAQIDAIINRDIKAFDNLYKDLFINDEGEMLLALFERTLHADSKNELAQIIKESLKVLEHIQES